MKNKPADKLQRAAAAREAFQAYEKAVEVAQQFIDAGPVSVGTTVMAQQLKYRDATFKCSECGHIGEATGWKFCPGCASEIMRFDRLKEPEVARVFVNVEKPKKI